MSVCSPSCVRARWVNVAYAKRMSSPFPAAPGFKTKDSAGPGCDAFGVWGGEVGNGGLYRKCGDSRFQCAEC